MAKEDTLILMEEFSKDFGSLEKEKEKGKYMKRTKYLSGTGTMINH